MVEQITEHDAATELGVTNRRVRQLAEQGVLTRHPLPKGRVGYDRKQVHAVVAARALLRGH